MPSILFLHTNFPAQFGVLGERLAGLGWDVSFATRREGARHPAMTVLNFAPGRAATKGVHPYVAGTEQAVITGQHAVRTLIEAREGGLRPDIVMCHSGWGAGMFARDVFPDARFVPYVEWWYRYPPVDTVMSGEFEPNLDSHLRQRVRNAPILLDLEGCDLALCPTRFQASQFPARLRTDIRVIHDGIDTAMHAPLAERPGAVAGLRTADMPEIVTYATRGMEPQRGFPQFIRALERLQRERPGLHALILGEDRVAYGRKLPEGDSWKTRMLAECRLDPDRTHFLGLRPRRDYVAALQAADVHVYLTVPFVLSWSMLEAMACACPLVLSDTPPVREVADADAAALVDMARPASVAEAVAATLGDPAAAARRGARARETVVASLSEKVQFPRKAELFDDLLGGASAPARGGRRAAAAGSRLTER